ncbi:hypothetical protein Pcinc_036505 [Petrolisthes cinctipes]|uniref:Uncharacterized protein n=1 Tax=Petrolisthes cinctipes TaxID=88211 RepID=A0AAE1EMA8_PETCI|nr:hypothetical protein Pcinc_036505 [Petrolisthes cinctipes]
MFVLVSEAWQVLRVHYNASWADGRTVRCRVGVGHSYPMPVSRPACLPACPVSRYNTEVSQVVVVAVVMFML